MALHSELPIYKVAYDLSDLAIDLVRNMPRDVKGVIGSELRDQCLTLVVLIYRANVSKDKVPYLTDLIERLQVAELLLRLSRDKQFISTKHYALVRRHGFTVNRALTQTYRHRGAMA